MTDKTILIIDNDEALVDVQSFYFSEHGYTVYTALDGEQGIELAIRHSPAAIVCDVIMEKLHGLEVLQALRRRPELSRTVVIMTSAKAYRADIARALELGATDYVVKPFRTDELLAVVERHLAAPRGA